MIEVMQSGTNQRKQKLITRCKKCGCIFSFIDDDSFNGGDLLHSRPLCEDYVYCPECEEKIVVHETSCYSNPEAILCEIVEPDEIE
jgi:hypothetical protein